jgi:esterase/lipase
MKRVFIIIACVLGVLIIGTRLYSEWEARLNRATLEKFTAINDTGSFVETVPISYATRQKAPYAVLLLQGYVGSTKEWRGVAEQLRDAQIPFYAPRLTGFGLSDTHLLEDVKPSDWKRDALEAYDLLSTVADRVSVVGHSTGGTLATFVASKRPVDRLILSAPNLAVGPEDRWKKKLLQMPVIGQLFMMIKPYTKKPVREGRVLPIDTRDPVAAEQTFTYLYVPTRSVKAQWDLQDSVHISQAKYNKLVLMFGRDDQTIDREKVEKEFNDLKIPYEEHIFENSGHNILEDYDKEEVAKLIVSLLKDHTAPKLEKKINFFAPRNTTP